MARELLSVSLEEIIDHRRCVTASRPPESHDAMSRQNPIITNHATEIYRAITIELERQRQVLSWSMWQVDDASGVQDGHYAKLLHADRPSGRQVDWKTLQLVVSALFPRGFDVCITHKTCAPLTAESHRLKVMFASTDKRTRRDLMSELGKRGAKARMLKLGKRERKKIARVASKAAAIKRTKAAAARAQLQSEAII
jgi:hypothetical protein